MSLLQPKPFASLSSGLLARKGAARPAMRPQGFASLAPTPQQLEDLGWNDMGQPGSPDTEPVERPPVLVAREALVEAVEAPVAVDAPVAEPVEAPAAVATISVATATRLSRETAHKGRAAFTLRLDAEPHLRLRLASALANRSAQQLVAFALDRFLDTMPEIAALRAQLPPQTLTRSKGKTPMNKSRVASLAVLAYGGIFVMSAASAPRDPSVEAAKQAERVIKALGRHEADEAVVAAELAVQFAPTQAGYRLLLGQSYLQAGRFTSAGQAFADTLTLDPANGKAALNLALTQVAMGDWQAARRTLATHVETISAGDRGLAMALAGDTDGAVALLTEVARSPEASPKVRQNLALTYALAGQWQEARVVAAADMSPADVDARIEQWAAFVQPASASDQVASLLGVRPVSDHGQPAALALNAPAVPAVPAAPVAVAQVEAAPVAAPMTVAQLAAAPVAATPAVKVAQVSFGPRQEVVQPLAPPVTAAPAAPLIAATPGPVKLAVAGQVGTRFATAQRVAVPAHGQWFVQLGAYDSAGVAKDDWGRARRRYAAFAGHTPQGATIKVGPATYYRLSVGGFARADADHACHAYRARGGKCFVRMGAGEQVASWARSSNVRVAHHATASHSQVAMR